MPVISAPPSPRSRTRWFRNSCASPRQAGRIAGASSLDGDERYGRDRDLRLQGKGLGATPPEDSCLTSHSRQSAGGLRLARYADQRFELNRSPRARARASSSLTTARALSLRSLWAVPAASGARRSLDS